MPVMCVILSVISFYYTKYEQSFLFDLKLSLRHGTKKSQFQLSEDQIGAEEQQKKKIARKKTKHTAVKAVKELYQK